MNKNILALYEPDEDYIMNLLGYMHNHRDSLAFDIHAFTKIEDLRIFVNSQHVAILLVSEAAMTEEISGFSFDRLILLTEGRTPVKYQNYSAVTRYQNIPSLLKEVLSCYADDQEEHAEKPVLKGNTRIIGIYSPVGRCLKTSYALTLGQLLAEQRPTLYLNFEGCAGFAELLHTNSERDIEDFIYYMRQGEANLSDKLNVMTERLGDLRYLPPARSVQDVLSTTIEEWMQLIDLIKEKSSYERLILDIGNGVNGLREMLSICDVLYVPVLGGVAAEAKIHQFKELLRLWDAEEILRKLKLVQLPYSPSMERKDRYAEQLVFSPLGDYARDRIEKDRL